MNKLDSSMPVLSYSQNTISHLDPSTVLPVAAQHPGTLSRFLVLVPDDSDYRSATSRISELAHANGAHVLFLGLCKDAAHELSLRRELITLSALLQHARVAAEAKVESGANWVDIVRSNYHAGDIVLCFAEQRADLLHRPLNQILGSNLRAPVYILSGLSPKTRSRSAWFSEAVVWAGSISIIMGAFLLQVRIVSMPSDWAQTTLLVLSVVAEGWLISVWNSLFG